MNTVDITIKIKYDPNQFPEDVMRWAADKVTECGEIYNIGYDFDAFEITSTIKHEVEE